jgi:hypothetical protein
MKTMTEEEILQAFEKAGGKVGIGLGLDWDSPLIEIDLIVELPFWLLMPAGWFTVTVNGVTTEVAIDNNAIEIQRGHRFTRTHRNTVFIGNEILAERVAVPVDALPSGAFSRRTRTLLTIKAFAMKDALDAFFGSDEARFQDGSRYFASLAAGHLVVVNQVVNAYRRSSIDPYTHEVTAWDVPVWFVYTPALCQSVCLQLALADDGYPTIGKMDTEEQHPLITATEQEFNANLSAPEVPGEIEMLDGWSLFHSGRFADSIRSFVTAIEVLLEAQITRICTRRSDLPEAIESRLADTRNNFEKRLTDYCELSGRRVPGPLVGPIPYINGVRLVDEITRTRSLRHRIVHHGLRLDQSVYKPMLRSAETTSWLFDWLMEDGDFESRRRKHSNYYFSTRVLSAMFRCEARDGKLVVVPPPTTDDDPSEVFIVKGQHAVHNDDMLTATLSPLPHDGKDIEHFVAMCFYELGFGEIPNGPYPTDSNKSPPRYMAKIDEKNIEIYLADMAGTFGPQDLENVISNIKPSQNCNHIVLVLNDQMDRPWIERSFADDPAVDIKCHENQISIVRTPDLARSV